MVVTPAAEALEVTGGDWFIAEWIGTCSSSVSTDSYLCHTKHVALGDFRPLKRSYWAQQLLSGSLEGTRTGPARPAGMLLPLQRPQPGAGQESEQGDLLQGCDLTEPEPLALRSGERAFQKA